MTNHMLTDSDFAKITELVSGIIQQLRVQDIQPLHHDIKALRRDFYTFRTYVTDSMNHSDQRMDEFQSRFNVHVQEKIENEN